ncbi:MAG: hypothetical protein F6K30_09975 [Cyanothece sp. SIO2G6]|nr:hypothetical protein [Cyanothece sp. SIO2G6]
MTFTINFWPFQLEIDTVLLLGGAIWALALYLGLSPLSNWVVIQLSRWFNFAEERFLYTSKEELDRTRQARESQNEFLASLLSILPFLVVGLLSEYGIESSLGQSWAISTGIMFCLGSAVYELGRRTSEMSD